MDKVPQIELIKKCLVEIATPYNTGTGFYVKSYDVIVTNEHVIRDNREVVIKGKSFEKQIAQVVFIDERADIALVRPPDVHNMPEIVLRTENAAVQGETIFALGHPYGLKLATTHGVISSIEQKERGITLIQHDAALNPGNSGGPLVDRDGHVIGLNSFVLVKGENMGFALPIAEVHHAMQAAKPEGAVTMARCRSCRNVVYDNQLERRYCKHCGAEILFPNDVPEYAAVGVTKMVEDIITELGYDVRLTREGKNHWNIQRGSALVRLSYHQDAGLIDGDAYLCRLPDQNVNEIYTYMMQENFMTGDLTFSVKGPFVLLSLMIFDRHLDEETGKKMLEGLFAQADHYDDILIDRFGASWIE